MKGQQLLIFLAIAVLLIVLSPLIFSLLVLVSLMIGDLIYIIGGVLILGLIGALVEYFQKHPFKAKSKSLGITSDYTKNKYEDETYSEYIKRKTIDEHNSD